MPDKNGDRGITHSNSTPVFSSHMAPTVAMIRDAVPVDRSSMDASMTNGVDHRTTGLGADGGGVAPQHLHRPPSSQKVPSVSHLAHMQGARADDDDCEDIIVWKPK